LGRVLLTMRNSNQENDRHHDALRQRPRSSIVTPGRPRGRLRLRETRAGAYTRPRPAQCPVCNRALGPPTLNSPDRLHGVPGIFSVAQCPTCGLGVTLPAAGQDEIADFYPTTYGAHGLPTGVQGLISAAIQRLQRRQAFRTAPLERLADQPAGRVFDVGCGRGDLGSWLTQLGWSVTGVEPSPQACAVARGRGVDARLGTLAEVELEPESYDVAVFRQSLEHVADPVADLRRALGALRSGGMAIISVPNFGCWQRRRFGGAWFHLDLPRHRFHFDAEALRATLEAAGFADVQMCTSSSTAGLPVSVQYATLGRCIFTSGLAQRVAFAACALTAPAAWLIDRLTGGGDVLHAVAYKR